MKLAMRWGLYIGLANLIWLYVAYYLGLHTNGVMVFQLFMLVWLLLSLTGFVLTLRAVKRQRSSLGYLSGLGAGAVAATMSAVVAVVAQIGYYKVVHPEWPEVMANQTREHFTAQGLPPAEIEQHVEQARQSFTLANYAAMSAITALIIGIVLSAIIMAFLRSRSPSAATAA